MILFYFILQLNLVSTLFLKNRKYSVLNYIMFIYLFIYLFMNNFSVCCFKKKKKKKKIKIKNKK